MSYNPVRTPLVRRPVALSGLGNTPAMNFGAGVLVVGAVVGIGYLIYRGSKNEREVRKQILDKEGSTGLARYEDAQTKRAAVEGGLGILSGLAWGGNNGMRRNGRSSSRRRRTSRRR
jgi:hypothetical protein